MDALRAVAVLPQVVGDRELFEAVLAGTMVKRSADVEAFREAFVAFFLPDEPGGEVREGGHEHEGPGLGGFVGIDVVASPSEATDGGKHQHEHGRRIDLRRFFGEGVRAPGHDHHAGDRWRLTWLGGEQVFDRTDGLLATDRGTDGAFGLRRVATAGQPGRLQAGGGLELPRDVALRGRREESVAAGGDPVDDEVAARIRRRMAEGQTLRTSGSGGGGLLAAEREPLELKWDVLTSDDLRRLERAVEWMGRRLGGAPGSKRPARGGRLDARRTARRAAATEGVPFAPVYLARRDDRPRLVVLCDVSLSVRGAARFLLQVTRAAQRQDGRVRSFVFVRDVAEVTRLLAGDDLDRAIAAIFDGCLIDTAEGSDSGAALGAFVGRYGGLLSRKTTVLILGDGRNNGRDPGLEALEAIRRRVRRIVWLTPEARGTWRLPGCDLPRYAAWCDLVAPVRTPAALERVTLMVGS
jgi:uncharacterized protein with von Willebrand factor type A (vWA) domain